MNLPRLGREVGDELCLKTLCFVFLLPTLYLAFRYGGILFAYGPPA